MADETASHLRGLLSPDQLAKLDETQRLLTQKQRLAVQKTYTDAFQQGMLVACGVAAAALVAAAMAWKSSQLTIPEKRKLLNERENERREKQLARGVVQ